MSTIVEMRFGSHLYGTDTPASDTDIKAVHVPAGRDILLGRAKASINRQTKADPTSKNGAGDTDFESYSLQKYLSLAAEGQTVALDMLFAPPSAFLRPPSWIWKDIQENRHRLLTSKCASFLGYCRTQANKYGIKGSRVAAARAALALLDSAVSAYDMAAKLGLISTRLDDLAANHEHIEIVDVPLQRLGMEPSSIRHLEVCGRKMPFTATIKNARDVVARLVAEYGQRALQAESNQGVDWKALSHAVRIGRQAIEVLDTGFVTFPRPEAAHLLAVKRGELPYQAVAEEIEALLVEVEAASARSSLPAEPDRDWIDDFVADAYRDAVGLQYKMQG